jgi:hypothetical protein
MFAPKPPLPAPSSLPFQPARSGSQTSTLIDDPGTGDSVACTRQKGGGRRQAGLARLEIDHRAAR